MAFLIKPSGDIWGPFSECTAGSHHHGSLELPELGVGVRNSDTLDELLRGLLDEAFDSYIGAESRVNLAHPHGDLEINLSRIEDKDLDLFVNQDSEFFQNMCQVKRFERRKGEILYLGKPIREKGVRLIFPEADSIHLTHIGSPQIANFFLKRKDYEIIEAHENTENRKDIQALRREIDRALSDTPSLSVDWSFLSSDSSQEARGKTFVLRQLEKAFVSGEGPQDFDSLMDLLAEDRAYKCGCCIKEDPTKFEEDLGDTLKAMDKDGIIETPLNNWWTNSKAYALPGSYLESLREEIEEGSVDLREVPRNPLEATILLLVIEGQKSKGEITDYIGGSELNLSEEWENSRGDIINSGIAKLTSDGYLKFDGENYSIPERYFKSPEVDDEKQPSLFDLG